MTPTLLNPNHRINRRSFLAGAGVAVALPLLDAMTPAFNRAQEAGARVPRRMVAIETNLGILPQFFTPEGVGMDYRPSPYLEVLSDFRREMTVFGGVSHPGVDGGHSAERAFLTAAPHPGAGTFRNTISLDQVAAERIGNLTRIPALVTHVGVAGRSLSFTRSGVEIPAERSVAALYRRMFVQGSANEVNARVHDLQRGRSVLDFVNNSAKRLQKDLGPGDRARLDQYFSSVRDLENRMQESSAWERRPKPAVRVPAPTDVAPDLLPTASRLMFDLIRLALETDSTRLVTVFIEALGRHSDIPGVDHETHTLTHHGNRPEALAELRLIETAQFRALASLLAGLKGAREGTDTLLDRTMVLYGSCMSSANAHSNVNLPILLAGGGFRHAGHLMFDTQRNYPLPNLFVSMLQRLGIETDRFATSTGTMRGLELA
jgi:hypothetical protein